MQFDFVTVMYILAGCIIVLFGWIGFLHSKIRRLLKGKNAKSLEDSILHNQTEIESLRSFEKECLTYFEDVEKRLTRSVQAVETVRFNPFKGTGDGGNQSFSTALLNERGDGVVVSSMYSRDRVSVFSKPLHKFQSEFELTEEENHVVDTARKSLRGKEK